MSNARRDAARRQAADEAELAQYLAARDSMERRERKNLLIANHAEYLAHDGFETNDAQDLIEQWKDPTGHLAREMLFQVVKLKDAVRKLNDVARAADKQCQRLMEKICEKYGRLPPAARYTPPPEDVAAAGTDLEKLWRTQLPPRLVAHMDEAFAEAERAQTSRSARQQENEDQELLRQFGVSYPNPFTPRHHIPDEALADLDADLETARANYIDLGMGRSRTARRDGDDHVDLLRLCTQQTNWHHGQRGARLVAEAQAMHDSGELRRNEYPFYPFSQDWSIFNAPFHRLPAKAQTLLQRHYPEEFARLAPGGAARPPDRRRCWRCTRAAAQPRRARPAQHAPAVARTPRSRDRHARRLHGRVDRPLQDRLGRGRGTLVWASGRAGRLRLRLQRHVGALRVASERRRDRRERGRRGDDGVWGRFENRMNTLSRSRTHTFASTAA